MNKYDTYKPSGIAWIGDAPEEWEKCRFKNFITLINKPTVGGNKIGLENIESGSGKLLPTDSEFDGDGVGFIAGDIVYGKLRPYLMKVWVAEFPGNAVGDFFVFRVKDNADSSFVKYLMLSDGFTKEANGATEGAKMPRVSSDFILTLRYYLPSKEEQTAIADYLDAKCAKIDNVVAVQQKRIELLKELKQSIITHAVTKGLDKNAKMKDSGIEWIGEVPKEWRVMKINYLVNAIADVNHYMPNDVDCGYPYAMTGDLKECANEIDFDDCKQISVIDFKELSKKVKAEKGDVIFARYATIGTVCYVDIEKDFIVSYSCVTIKPKHKMLQGKYLYYYLKSHTFFEGISQSVNSNTQGNVGIESLSAEKMVVPSMEEQTAITTYLDKKCAIIDRQIVKVEKQIELLNEYKQSVITECVTGKRKVC